ncbi:MAG: hypothetical protein ABIE55_00890 [Candidatus Aenigmatarchaeota archaeon]
MPKDVLVCLVDVEWSKPYCETEEKIFYHINDGENSFYFSKKCMTMKKLAGMLTSGTDLSCPLEDCDSLVFVPPPMIEVSPEHPPYPRAMDVVDSYHYKPLDTKSVKSLKKHLGKDQNS